MKNDAVFPNRPTRALVGRAEGALGMTHRQFGVALGASERTAARWHAGSSSIGIQALRKLAVLVYPRNAALAAEIAAACSETLASLGVVVPAPVFPRLAPHLMADLVLCAAAEAAAVPPATARAALFAAFARMKEVGLTVAEMESALAAGRGSAT